jgi:holo-[acyl-carrier protein] synthase
VIVRLGFDAIETARIGRALERHPGFAARVFTERENAAAERRGVGRVAYLARRWAGKEAVSKALGVGFSGYSYKEIEIVNAGSGAPVVALHDEVAEWASSLGIIRWHLSLSDTKEMAFATALAEGPDDYPRRPSGPPPWIRRRLADTDPGALLPDPGAPGISGFGGIPGAPTWPGGR